MSAFIAKTTAGDRARMYFEERQRIRERYPGANRGLREVPADPNDPEPDLGQIVSHRVV